LADVTGKRMRAVFIGLLIFIAAAGGFLRLKNLGHCSYWVDETNALFAAKSLLENGTMVFPSGFVYDRAPLYTMMTAASFRCFGVSEASTRLPAALFGILSIFMAYATASRLFDRRTGLMTAFLTAFCHFEVGWSRTAKMYTLLQFLSLLAVYAFARGFEATGPYGSRKSFSAPGRFFKRWGLSPTWLAVCAAALACAYWVHSLALFLGAGFLLYALGVAVVQAFTAKERGRSFGPTSGYVKYAAFTAGVVLTAGLALTALPQLREKIIYFVRYTPAWAEGGSSAQNRHALFDFLISPERFPLAAFFIIGNVYLVSRRCKPGWMAWCPLAVTFMALTFVFTHRAPTYLFFVYPLFLAIAAYGLTTFVAQETAMMKRGKKKIGRRSAVLLAAGVFSVFLASSWLRITLHIPYFPDGHTNMAVTPEEWREASKTVLERKQPGDLVVTSLPQLALVYGLHSDFCLNWADLALTRVEEIMTRDGRPADIYAGVPCIQTSEEWEGLIGSHQRGWLALSRFHLENENYIPESVKEFILNRLGPPLQTVHGTVLIYHWEN
jgi:4-amino-4-deoxy-L-arabinose transferase-like glycosyltransferase